MSRRINNYKNCLYCNKVFKIALWDKDKKFCSNYCRGMSKRKPIKKLCERCGKEFYVTPSRKNTARFCSFICTKTPYIKRICKNCNNEFSFHPERLKRNAGIFCGDKCRYEYFRLHGNPNWHGGKSFEPYPLGWSRTYKEQIRYKDGYKCQICGIPEIENCRKLAIHHIDYNKENINPENLISLCVFCHTKTNFNRDKWKEYFNAEDKICLHSL